MSSKINLKFSCDSTKKEETPLDFLLDETNDDSQVFLNFLDVFVVQNRVLRLIEDLFRETFAIK